jgi:hypothetical protein
MWLSIIIAVFCASCSIPANFTMYPDRLTGSETLPADTAIVLVGVTGQAAVNYLQFGHSTMPAINALATLDVNQPGKYSQAPIPDQLGAARQRFAIPFAGLEPANFVWPDS